MELILFGAGASFGSDTNDTPPLGRNLLEALIRFNPGGWGKIPEKYTKTFRNDFEQGILELSNSNILPPLQRVMAAYFFQFTPAQSNLYLQLSRRIKQAKWEGALITFNYERLLEISLSRSGIRPVMGDGTATPEQIEVCFPHGCCHLFCDTAQGGSNAVSFSPFVVKTTCSKPRVISDPKEFNQRIRRDAFPPIMSYFEPKKRSTSGANVIEHQRRRYVELVSTASKIIIVGLKVRPHDTHVWGPLAETQAKLIYCSGKASVGEFEEWTHTNRRDKENDSFEGYFEPNFDKICTELRI